MKSLLTVLLAVLLAMLAVLALGACATVPPVPVAGQAPMCATQPDRIYYGSCGAKRASGPASCALCEGARGCTAFAGLYCVGVGACDDRACR